MTRGRKREFIDTGGMPAARQRGDRYRVDRGAIEAFPIVGIGASAGGLEAIESFLRPLPEVSGAAFIIVQHLDPTRKGMMVELLSRATPMKVLQVKDGMRVEPDHVYIIPPNQDLSILHGALHLLSPTARRGLRLPIDFFFRSIADDRRSDGIGVILSGMGADGTLGAGAIKAQGGAVFVQAPSSAKFDAMPRSAIDAGYADVVAPVEDLAARVVAHCARTPGVVQSKVILTEETRSAIDKIFILLRSQTGHDFSQYKRSTVYRRIERRRELHKIHNIAGYVRLLQESPQENELLFKELLIGVTSFFRDPEVWEHLRKKALPELFSERPAGGVLRAWVPGCSTGEEAYSLAIVFKEVVDEVRPAKRLSLQIFATDLDKDAIERARLGVFPLGISGSVSNERLSRFFVKDSGGYRVGQEIRETVIFATQNVIMDPPFTKLDIVSCRNLLIYLSPDLQKKLLQLLHYSLNPGGILFLGSAETLGASANLFDLRDGKMRTYRRLVAAQPAQAVEFPVTSSGQRALAAETTAAVKTSVLNLPALAERFLLERYSPAAVLTNDKGDILYVSGHTGKYLEPAAGKANWNVHVMACEGLRDELACAFRGALRSQQAVTKAEVKVENNGVSHFVNVTIEPLGKSETLRGMLMILFSDVVAPAITKRSGKVKQTPAEMAKMAQELGRAREEVRTTREEMQTSQEELKSSNEELQSTNEELQSTNEELTTSKEEMQSMNEELQTLNNELQAKVDELSHANDDMRNLLDSTDVATLFLDATLRVRRFTTRMTKIVNLIPGDIGRPITDLASDLIYPFLVDDAREVLETLTSKEKQVNTLDGRWFAVRVMPYRTTDNRIDGIVITFADITASKTLEAALRRKQTDQ